MKIEKASLKDAEEIFALQKLAFTKEAELYGDFSIEPLTVTLEETKKEFKDTVFLKMTENGRIIGSVRGNKKDGTCIVRKLMVDPSQQNRGYGAALVRALEAQFKDCGSFELYTGYKSENNKHLYKKLGYIITETKKINDRVSAVHMVKGNNSADKKVTKTTNSVLKWLFIFFGLLSTGLGVAGMFLPVLPTTPFLLLAAFFFARSSDRFYTWLVENRMFGKYIKGYLEKKSIPLGIKVYAITMLMAAMAVTIIFFIDFLPARIALALIAAAVTVHILSVKTG